MTFVTIVVGAMIALALGAFLLVEGKSEEVHDLGHILLVLGSLLMLVSIPVSMYWS